MKHIVRILWIALLVGAFLGENTSSAHAQTPKDINVLLASNPEDLPTQIDTFMKEYIGKSVVGTGVVLIRDGKIVFQKGYGYADLAGKRKMNPQETIMEYASISKMYTWISVMQLVESGKIDLNKNMKAYLPEHFYQELENKLVMGKEITMLDLMNHTAGFEDKYFGEGYSCERKLSGTLEDALLVAVPKQIYTPKTVQAYSNYGTALAGLIVEKVTGQKLYDYVEAHIFNKIGAHHAVATPFYDSIQKIRDNKAKAYESYGEETHWEYVNWYPDGSVQGTAEDLAKLAIALMDTKSGLFQKEETYKKMFTLTYDNGKYVGGTAHGLAQFDGGSSYFGHDGGHDGFTSYVMFSPKTKSGVVLLTNQGGEVNTTYGLMSYLLGNGEEGSKPKITTQSDLLSDARELDGMEFADARCNRSDITKLYHALDGTTQIEAIAKDKFIMDGDTYQEISRDCYQNLETSFRSTLYIVRDAGEVVGYTFGAVDTAFYLRVKGLNTANGLLMQTILLLISILMGIGLLFYAIIKKMRRKAPLCMSKIIAGVQVLMDVFGILGLICITDLSIVYVNVFVVLNMICSVLYLFYLERDIKKRRNPMWSFIVSFVFFILFNVLLYLWNGYAFV